MAWGASRVRGFTLFELLVVLLLIGSAAALLAVGIGRGLHAANERSALAQMVATLRSARSQAIASGEPVRAHFDLQQRRLSTPGRRFVIWPEDFRLQVHSAQSQGAAFEFYPDGAASGGNLLVSRGERRWRIDIGWLTGRVHLQALP